MSDGIDFHSVRHRLKLLHDTGETKVFENRDGVPCPVCGDAFDEALATRDRTHRLAPDRRLELCLARENDRLLVFTHA